MAAGIDIRHRKRCTKPREDGKCCGASWQAYVYDKRTGKLIRRTFPNKTAAKQWRQDAITALRNGEQIAADRRDRPRRARRAARGHGGRHRPRPLWAPLQARYGPFLPSGGSGYLEPALGRLRLSEVRRGDVQRIVDRMHADGLVGLDRSVTSSTRCASCTGARSKTTRSRVPRSSHLRLPENRHKPRQVVNVDRAAELLDALPDTERALWATAVSRRAADRRASRPALDRRRFRRRRHPRPGGMGRPRGRAGHQDRSRQRGRCRSSVGSAPSSCATSSRPAATETISCSVARPRQRSRGRRCGHVPIARGRPPSSSRSHRTRRATTARVTWRLPA